MTLQGLRARQEMTLNERISVCKLCGLCATRNKTVPGTGPVPASIMVIGEGPGEAEDVLGVPLVGAAGKQLDKLFGLAGIPRSSCFITNVVKCRPRTAEWDNRKPTAEEVRACRPWLEAQIYTVHPKLIITLGDTALKWFDNKLKVGDVHGKLVKNLDGTLKLYSGAYLLPMYHPAAVLHDPRKRGQVEQDFRNLPSEFAIVESGYVVRTDYKIVTASWLRGFLPTLAGKTIALDLETDSGDMHTTEPVGYAVAWGSGQAVYVSDDPLLRVLREIPRDCTVVAHNSKFEWVICKRNGVDLPNLRDTKLAAYILGYPDTRLKSLALRKLDRRMTHIDELIGKGKNEISMRDVSVEKVAPYCCADADMTLQLHEIFEEELRGVGLWGLYHDVELPLIPVLGEMQLDGVGIDGEQLDALDDMLGKELEQALVTLRNVVEEPELNPASSKQLQTILFGKLHIPKCYKHGKLTTDKEAVAKLLTRNLGGEQKAALQKLVEWRTLAKMHGTYVTGIKKAVWPNGTLHVQFNQAGHTDQDDEGVESPATGRLSSSSPLNLQNIPRPNTKMGASIRRLFTPNAAQRR